MVQGFDYTPAQQLKDFGSELTLGNIPGKSAVHKFGAIIGITSSTVYKPVTLGEVYQTPQVSGATTLRVKAGNANDTAAGSGAREVTLQGLDETGAFIEVAVATAGASASTATTETFLRLFRAWVSASGTYATATAGSHAADIVIENGAGGTDWATLDSTAFPKAQTQIAVYSVPLGKQAVVNDYKITTGGNKPVDFIFFQRQNILETAAPYTAMRMILELTQVDTEFSPEFNIPLGPFPALTDIGWMAKGATTPDVTVDFEIELTDT